MAAILFKAQACTLLDLNKIACTSKLCLWKKSRRKAAPAPLHKINFNRPKKSETLPNVTENTCYNLKGFTSKEPALASTEGHQLEKLKLIAPNAAIFLNVSHWKVSKKNESDTDTADENEINSLPEPLTFLFDASAINDNEEELLEKTKKRFTEYRQTCYKSQFDHLIQITKLQADSKDWGIHRAGRITASISKEAFKTNMNNTSTSFINKIMQYSENISVPATRYGTKYEDIARNDYKKISKSIHANFTVEKTGLHIPHEFPYLGASPDGIVSCQCHGNGLLEIKCPYKYQKSLQEWITDSNCPINKDGTMKESHS